MQFPLGISSNPLKVSEKLQEAKAVWTDEGWVVEGNLRLSNFELLQLPTILKVGGNFWCSNNQLVTLQGAPQKVGGSFWCNNNQLITLEGAPQKVGGRFCCDYNQLATLEGAPQSVGAGFYCDNNQLATLEGAPQSVGGGFYCYNNLVKLTYVKNLK